MASQWEGLPVALMEALALGLPVVATDVGGVGEQLRDGDDALLVPPSDPGALAAALRVATDDVVRNRLAHAASKRAADFDIARTVETIEALYEQVASPTHRRAGAFRRQAGEAVGCSPAGPGDPSDHHCRPR